MEDLQKMIVEFRNAYEGQKRKKNVKLSNVKFSLICKKLEYLINKTAKKISILNDRNIAIQFIYHELFYILIERRKDNSNDFALNVNDELFFPYITKVLDRRINIFAFKSYLNEQPIVSGANSLQIKFKLALRNYIMKNGRNPDFTNILELNEFAKLLDVESCKVLEISSLVNNFDLSLDSSVSTEDDDDRTMLDILHCEKENPEQQYENSYKKQLIMNECKRVLSDLEWRIFSLYYFNEWLYGYNIETKDDIIPFLGMKRNGSSKSKIKNTIDKAKVKLSKNLHLKKLLFC